MFRRFAKLAPKLEKVVWVAREEVEWTWELARVGRKVTLSETAKVDYHGRPEECAETFPNGGRGVLMRMPM